MICDDVRIAANGDVTGTLLYVASYPNFSSSADEQHGNYFPVYIDKEGEQVTTDKDGTSKTQNFPDDHLLVIRVDKQSTKVKITVDSDVITTLNFAGATLRKG